MKRGFTLIELLAVIVILTIIALIAIPIVINIINDSKKSSQEESLKMYGKAVEDAIAHYQMINPNDDDITLDKIKGYIEYSGEKISCDTFQVGRNYKLYLADCNINDTRVEYTYGKYDPKPDLVQGLTPVIYDGNNWKIISSNDNNWYDYDNLKWANAVVLKENSTKKVGDIVIVEGNNSDVVMMYVWIPRYEYKIEGRYGKAATSAALPGEIEVNFISKGTTIATQGYYIHPAFIFGEKQESGFWVGKFELSHTELSSSASANNLGCRNVDSGVTCTSDSTKYRILPNMKSLRYNNVSNFWYGIKSIENTIEFGLSNLDIHMIKNSEWGAVAYLSQSKYGKYRNSDYAGIQKEIYINNSSNFYTGRSGGNIGGMTPIKETYANLSSTTQYNSFGFYTYDGYLIDANIGGKTEIRDINKGAGASTTGNIYGVYDMSGGSLEYVMGAYRTEEDGVYSGKNSTYNSGFKGKYGESGKNTNGLSLPESKYYDMYTNITNSNEKNLLCNNGSEYAICYGHGISETGSWYDDCSLMINANSPWLVLGGNESYNSMAGIFSVDNKSGISAVSVSTRVVIFENS